MKISQFWRFYNILCQYNFDETQLIGAAQVANFQKEIERQRQCSFACQGKCKDYANKNNLFFECDFYKLVVFGDEMIRINAEKNNRRFSSHALERHFFGSQFGGKDLIKRAGQVRELKEDKDAPIYYYMLTLGFLDHLTEQEGRRERDELYRGLRDSFIPTKESMLAPALYKDIKLSKAFDILGSAKKITWISIAGLLLLWLTLNAAWFFYTEDIRENLLQVQTLLKRMEK